MLTDDQLAGDTLCSLDQFARSRCVSENPVPTGEAQSLPPTYGPLSVSIMESGSSSGSGVGGGGDLWVGAWCLGGCVAVVWPHIEEPHGFQYCHQAARHLRL